MDGAEVLPKPVVFLDQNGNWPLCRTAKCKKNGTLAVYCEPEGAVQKLNGSQIAFCQPEEIPSQQR